MSPRIAVNYYSSTGHVRVGASRSRDGGDPGSDARDQLVAASA